MKKDKQKKSSFQKVLEEINFNIFNGQLTDIIEVTYAYKVVQKNVYWNETLFGYFAGFRYDSSLDLDNVAIVTSDKLHKKVKKITAYLRKLKEIDYLGKEEKIKAKILEGSLIYANNCLKITLLGLPFELGKAGFQHKLSDIEIKKRINDIEKFEKKNFGGKIIESQREISLAYNYILKIFREGKHLLTESEQKDFKSNYIKKIKGLLSPSREKYEVKYSYRETFSAEVKEKLATKISRKNYSKIFGSVLNDLLKLDFEILHEERSSIYDGPGFLAFPSSRHYDNLTLKRVIELIGHEVEVHCFTYRLNQVLLGNFRGAGNLEKEEGFAMTVEDFLQGRKLQEMTVTKSFVTILAAEIFELSELEGFMKLYKKLMGIRYTFQNILRQKRNYPLNYKGGQHKDVTYGRGKQKVLEFLKDGGDMRELYLGKVSLDDIPKIKKLLKYENIDISDLNIPIFLGELLLYLVITPVGKSNCTNFIKYLKKKYHFINFEKLDFLIVKEFVKVKISFDSLNLA